jgi:hypothetical protein
MTFPLTRRHQAVRTRGRAVAALLATLLLPAASSALAATFSVGPGATCTHTTLQAALDAAAASPGADTVRIVRSATWTAQQISTSTDQNVDIVGGYLACTSAAPDGKTTLSGAGGNARSVLALRGNGVFRLRNLVIRDGDQAGDDDGGGIHFLGGGILDIADSDIVENQAEDGGGIYAQGTTPAAELVIGANVLVSYNTARRHGGGVVAQNLEMTMIEPGSVLFMNTAGARGGGLIVASGEFVGYAYIGSAGIGDLGAVYGNHAAIGGGIAVLSSEDEYIGAEVQVFSRDPAKPVRIRANSASQQGGGIDIQPYYDNGLGGFPGSETYAYARLMNVAVEENTAPVGAAVNVSYDGWGPFDSSAMGGGLYINETPFPHPAAAACPVGAPCGYIRNNQTLNTTGAIVHLSEDARFAGSRIAIQGNTGGWLMYLSGEEATRMSLDNSLIAGNTVQNALIRDDENEDGNYQWVALNYLTIAGNTIGAASVLEINEDMQFTRSLIDQPGKALLAPGGGTYAIEHVIANTSTLPGAATLAQPRFVDSANGDYTPRAGARAVDFAPPLVSLPLDLYSRVRSVDIPVNPNEFGAADAGALERVALQPLLFNEAFDRNLDQWEFLANSAWDGTQNVQGPAGSGSVRGEVAADQARVAVRRQCIHLPGPARYALNGWGRVTGTAPFTPPNRVRLDWELRYSTATNDGCTNAPPGLTGSLLLASGATWTRPGVAALIDVTPAVWGQYTSLTIYLVVENGSPIKSTPDNTVDPDATLGGPDGWFDGISLLTDYDDTIFADGFE